MNNNFLYISTRQIPFFFFFLFFLATLTPGEVPGNFDQRFFAFQKPADYNVIWLDDETAMEYDCTSTLGVVNYCVHLMSRTQSIPQEKLDLMIAFAGKLNS